jgi:predicted aldo/keto reductase-like oxidoreductase
VARFERRVFGKTGIEVGPLGFGSAYGTPAKGLEMAFERGCNYFINDGAFGRGGEMTKATINLCKKGKREELFIAAGLNWRFAIFVRRAFYSFLKNNSLDYVDALILPWFNTAPAQKYFDLFEDLKEKGLVKYFGITGHNRHLFPELASKGLLDFFHCRYNAVHRGAEEEIFPKLPTGADRPGVVVYTATSWKQLLTPSKIPSGEKQPEAKDCYRFVLTDPNVNLSLSGAKSEEEVRHALSALDEGPMDNDELSWMRRIGDHIHS